MKTKNGKNLIWTKTILMPYENKNKQKLKSKKNVNKHFETWIIENKK